ncbi:MAG: hypothetical protein AWM53_00943 [Candidatus Dichloromethanomonas elyunquensis]|nr:MAG: hypothetical protein AWM53_00943 [Candidatus Dichloromethanomonas elyunquensis]
MTLTKNRDSSGDRYNIDTSTLIEVKVDKFIDFSSLEEHNFFEFYLFLSGEGVIHVNGIPYDISPGTFCFLTPFHLTQITVKRSQPLKYMLCKFNWSYIAKEHIYPIPQIQEINYFLTIQPFLPCDSMDFALLLETFERLYCEYRQRQDLLSPLFIKVHLISLFHLHAALSNKYNCFEGKTSLIIQQYKKAKETSDL